MRLAYDRIEVRAAGSGAGLAVEAVPDEDGGLTWSVANGGDAPVSVQSVSAVHSVLDVEPPLRLFRHGYQSWSPSGVATFGVDVDPSRTEGAIWLSRGMHHADPDVAWPGELRSEAVTVLLDAGGAPLLAGFVGGDQHDGTFRLRSSPDGSGGAELWAEAFLGGAVLAPGERRTLHPVVVEATDAGPAGVSVLLEHWAARVGRTARARTGAPYQAGWCSWYHYFHGISEEALVGNLTRAGEWPFDVFQLDDGYQAAIGDWLRTNDRFPSPLDDLAARVAAAGRTPGIWLAPFVAAPTSAVAAAHPGWFARQPERDRPLLGMWNEAWGGAVHTLDTSNPEVLAHLEAVARDLVAAGFPYLKLDFTYAPGLAGRFADPSMTPAQRVRAGFDAIRRGAGEDAFLLGCGAPLAATVGVVDGMRIGPDVAPWWTPPAGRWHAPGYEEAEPATLHAWRNTLARSFLHRRWWLNDPDCVMLRTRHTELPAAAARAWALAVGVSGGMALVSDDLDLLGPDARWLLDEVLALGRQSDAAAAAGVPPRCPDLLEGSMPAVLEAGGVTLVGDPATGTAVVQPALEISP